ncbi:hypothetical protein WH95_18495 [Kiloniella litopenaei]|uniref:Uncharacterized protein n=1 Tax=Kiloniella litopenaei TaxID=1549748 RepID=A0A0M2R1A8_9PROT|nr:hypothetical protein [Kiloniella litopenaei]KKJ75431.1 hypothetical protein WH95_18495 [Kiloniella litopenaei]
MINGWVCVHRRMVEWEWYTDANTFRVFMHLLLKANHEPKKWRGVTVKRGQLITGRKALSQELLISERSIRTALKNLKMTNDVTIEPSSSYSLITINNYEKYQDKKEPSDQQSDQQATSKRPASDQQATTNNNDNKITKEEGKGGISENEIELPKGVDSPTFSQLVSMAKGIKYLKRTDAEGAVKAWLKRAGLECGTALIQQCSMMRYDVDWMDGMVKKLESGDLKTPRQIAEAKLVTKLEREGGHENLMKYIQRRRKLPEEDKPKFDDIAFKENGIEIEHGIWG